MAVEPAVPARRAQADAHHAQEGIPARAAGAARKEDPHPHGETIEPAICNVCDPRESRHFEVATALLAVCGRGDCILPFWMVCFFLTRIRLVWTTVT